MALALPWRLCRDGKMTRSPGPTSDAWPKFVFMIEWEDRFPFPISFSLSFLILFLSLLFIFPALCHLQPTSTVKEGLLVCSDLGPGLSLSEPLLPHPTTCLRN